MDAKEHLFDAFPATSKEQWIQQVIKDLKGGDFNSLLTYTSRDGITIQPFYTTEDLAVYSERKPLFAHTDWEVCEEIIVVPGTEQEANKKALYALEHGATGLVLRVQSDVALATLLQDIGMEYIRLRFVLQENISAFDAQLSTYISGKGLDVHALNLAISYDPIRRLLDSGNWEPMAERSNFLQHIKDTQGAHNLCIEGTIYHNAGAAPAHELACILAHANEYLQWSDAHTTRVEIAIAVGPDYFFEIAKLRALRKVWALLTAAYNINDVLSIHAVTATRNLTLYDTHNNLLRTTTEAMAASIGGCDSLVVKPFDCFYNAPNAFSGRLARNIQLLLKAESYIDKVADVAAGSFFMETLTEQLAEKAWNLFQTIESEGGFIAALEKGSIQNSIEESAAAQQQRFDEEKEVLVGTNKFPDKGQLMADKVTGIHTVTLPEGTLIRPLMEKRLSNAAEQERLQAETTVNP